jgi:hypothetical protein
MARSLARFTALPTTIFLDAAGRVSYVHIGEYTTERALVADIDRHARAEIGGSS